MQRNRFTIWEIIRQSSQWLPPCAHVISACYTPPNSFNPQLVKSHCFLTLSKLWASIQARPFSVFMFSVLKIICHYNLIFNLFSAVLSVYHQQLVFSPLDPYYRGPRAGDTEIFEIFPAKRWWFRQKYTGENILKVVKARLVGYFL